MGTRQFHLSHWRVSGIFSSPKAVSVSLLALIFWPAYWTLMVLCSGHGMLSDGLPIWTFQLLCALHLPVCCRNT
ncbi:uncharacterized protein EDB93DRAFT_1172455, partial [Suillus bovinus]|uniref:uncharacterized protein n=1 Tax=Suillus bovinus TaxID=48563 RepID=UPI001B881ABE